MTSTNDKMPAHCACVVATLTPAHVWLVLDVAYACEALSLCRLPAPYLLPEHSYTVAHMLIPPINDVVYK